LVEGLIILIVGAMVYTRDTTRRSNIYFFLLAITIGIWAIAVGVFALLIPGALESAFLVLHYVLGALIFPMVLLFILSLTVEPTRISNWLWAVIWLPVVAIISAVLVPGFIIETATIKYGAVKEVMFGEGYIFYILYIISYVFVGLTVAGKRYLASAGVYRTQFAYIILVFAISSIFGILSQLYFPFIGIYDLGWLGTALATTAMVGVGYIMILYNFWNKKLILTETLVLIGAAVFLFDVFTSQSVAELIINPAILMLVIIGSIFLLKNVKKETESKEKVEKLARQLSIVNKELVLLDKRKTDFVGTTAFRFRGPLTAVKGYASLLLEGSFGKLSESSMVAVDRVFQSSEHLNDIIGDFTDVMKIERGEVSYEHEHIELKGMVQDILTELSVSLRDAGITARVHSKEQETYNIMGDTGKVRQSLSNLIDNAIKYAPNGMLNISLSKNAKDKSILLSITDKGMGMTTDTLQRIFEKFNRGKDANRYHTGGTGLGLYVAKEILRMHYADITAESEGQGKGSTFNIIFRKNGHKKISKK